MQAQPHWAGCLSAFVSCPDEPPGALCFVESQDYGGVLGIGGVRIPVKQHAHVL